MLSREQKDLLASLSTNYKTGRALSHDDDDENESPHHQGHGELNIIKPPLNCPKWACIILPCINHIPSMKLFKSIVPREAEVRIGSRWVCYDASSLNRGDIIRLSEGDIVPADARLLSLGPDFVHDGGIDDDSSGLYEGEEDDTLELIVDSNQITGEPKPRIISLNPDRTVSAVELYAGSVVLHGEAIAVVTKIGGDVLLSRLMREGKWPPKQSQNEWQIVSQNDNEEDEGGDDNGITTNNNDQEIV